MNEQANQLSDEIVAKAEELGQLIHQLPKKEQRFMARTAMGIIREVAIPLEVEEAVEEGNSENFAPFGMVLLFMGAIVYLFFPMISRLLLAMGVFILVLSFLSNKLKSYQEKREGQKSGQEQNLQESDPS